MLNALNVPLFSVYIFSIFQYAKRTSSPAYFAYPSVSLRLASHAVSAQPGTDPLVRNIILFFHLFISVPMLAWSAVTLEMHQAYRSFDTPNRALLDVTAFLLCDTMNYRIFE